MKKEIKTTDLKSVEAELVQFASLNKNVTGIERIACYEKINEIPKKAINLTEYAINLIFEELKIEFNIENLKRITKVYPNSILGAEKYYLDYGKESEVLLFSSERYTSDFSESDNKITIMHKLKSNFKCINSGN